MKLPVFSASTVLFGTGLGCLFQAIAPTTAWANCTGEQINGICFTNNGSGQLERTATRLDQVQQSNSLQLTVELDEEMEVAIAAPQLTTGTPDPNGTQLQANLSALSSTVDNTTRQTITLPANQPITLTVDMDVTRPQAFVPDSYGYDVQLNFVPTATGGTTTDYDVTFAGTVETTCLNDAVNGGTLAASGLRSLSSVGTEGIAGRIVNLRCNADVNVSAVAAAVASTPAVSNFATCRVALEASTPVPCDGSATAELNQAALTLSNAAVHLDLLNYQAAPSLPAGTYEYVVTLTVVP